MKLYVAIQRFLNKNWVHYIVLFFILISIVAVIASSFEEMSRYRLALFGITYISSFVFLLEYAARILSAPALHPTKSAIKARLHYTFSFYGFVDFVAILPCVLTYIYWNTEVVHIIILPYIFIIFKLIRHSRSFRLIGKALYWFFVKFGGNLFFISPVFFFLNPIKSCRYVCFLVTLKTPHH